MESFPSDVHNIVLHEDMLHEPTPKCRCKPIYLGRNKRGKRVFEHRTWDEVLAVVH